MLAQVMTIRIRLTPPEVTIVIPTVPPVAQPKETR